MTPTRIKLRSLLIHLAAVASLVVLIATIYGWFSNIGNTTTHRLSQLEITFHPDSIALHRVTQAEELYRQELAVHAGNDAVYEQRLKEMDRGMRAIDPDDPQYQSAVHRYYDLKAERDEYRDSTPKPPKQRHVDLALPLVWIVPAELLLAAGLCFISWRRWEAGLRRRVSRRIRWDPTERLTLFKSARRFTFLAGAVISMVVAVGIGGLWVRSHYVSDHIDHLGAIGTVPNITFRQRTLNTFRGGVSLGRADYRPNGVATPFMKPEQFYAQIRLQWRNRGEVWHRSRSNPMGDPNAAPWHGVDISHNAATHILIAYWTPLLVFLLLPTLWLITHVRLRRLLEFGMCQCGYDLTGNTSGVCPECGVTVRTTPARSDIAN